MSMLSRFLDESPSRIIGEYEILSKFANGGYSDIFLAEALKSKNQVVVKSPFKCKNSGSKLLKESKLMEMLKDIKGVPQLVETIISDGVEALVLQKLGPSMDTLIKEHMNFSLKTVIMIAVQLIETLKGVHERGVIHRDIKPGNILISSSKIQQTHLIDYGLAKRYLTQKGTHKLFNIKKSSFKGTPMFASRNMHFGYSISTRDDLESLGYTLVYLYKGFLPWSNWNKCNMNVRSLGKFKAQFFSQGVFPDLPLEFRQFFENIGKLKYDEKPDYGYLSGLFLQMAKRYDLDLNVNKWEWSEDVDSETNSSNGQKSKEFNYDSEEPVIDEPNIEDESNESFNGVHSNLMALKMISMNKGKFPNEGTKTKEFIQMRQNFQKSLFQKE